MNEKLKVNAVRFKNHVKRQKWAYGYAALAAMAMATVVRERKTYNEFLTEKGIDLNEFYTPEMVKS